MARSEATWRSAVASAAWQSHPIKTRLPRPFRAHNDIVKIYIAFILVYFSSYTIPFYIRKVGLINQAPTEDKKCGFDESNPYDNIIIKSY